MSEHETQPIIVDWEDLDATSSIKRPPQLTVDEIVDEDVTIQSIGQCKWFNASLGYGFLTIRNGKDVGKDIFVHHSGIHPSNSQYRTLWKGEYVSFSMIAGPNGPQATHVTGVCGGSIMCDVLPLRRHTIPPPPFRSCINQQY